MGKFVDKNTASQAEMQLIRAILLAASAYLAVFLLPYTDVSNKLLSYCIAAA